MKIKSFFLTLFAVVALSACSSSSDSKCEDENFGYLKLNIPNSENQTAVTYTLLGSSTAGSETIAAHKSSAKIEIPVGTYTIAVEQVNGSGQSVTDPVIYSNVVIEQCETVTKTITSFE